MTTSNPGEISREAGRKRWSHNGPRTRTKSWVQVYRRVKYKNLTHQFGLVGKDFLHLDCKCQTYPCRDKTAKNTGLCTRLHHDQGKVFEKKMPSSRNTLQFEEPEPNHPKGKWKDSRGPCYLGSELFQKEFKQNLYLPNVLYMQQDYWSCTFSPGWKEPVNSSDVWPHCERPKLISFRLC